MSAKTGTRAASFWMTTTTTIRSYEPAKIKMIMIHPNRPGQFSSKPRLESSSIFPDEWTERADRLIASEPGTWSSEDWTDALELTRYWKGTGDAWLVMDRLVVEESQKKNVGSVRNGLLSELVHAWKETPGEVKVRDVVGRLESYRKRVPDLTPPTKLYNMLLDTAVRWRETEAQALAQETLNSLLDAGQDNRFCRPDTLTFNICIYALAKSGSPDAPQRAEALVDQMHNLTANGWQNVEPDETTFTNLVSTWANSKESGAAERAEDLLRTLPGPTTMRFNAVLSAWAKSEQPDSADRSASLFQYMRQLYRNGANARVKPVTSTYGIAIAALAKRGRAREAEALMEDLLRQYDRNKDPDLVPDRIHFNSLIDAWAKSGEKGAAERAEGVLNKMRILSKETRNPSLTPDATSYTSCIHAWAKSNDPLAGARAELILERMRKMYEAGDPKMKPNLLSYSAVLDCLANTRSIDSADRAEAILGRIMGRYKKGDKDMMLNAISFNTVINAFAKSGDKDAAIKAEAVFDRMKSVGVQPTARTFSCLISTWTNSRDSSAGEKAEKYLLKMNSLYEAGDDSCKPDTTMFSAAINAWSTSKDPHSISRARAILTEMKRLEAAGHSGCSPNEITYCSLLNVIAKSQARDKALVAWDVLLEMDARKLKIQDRTFGSALMSCAFSRGYDRITRQRAFKVATNIIHRAHAETKPSSQTYGFFFTTAAGLKEDKIVALVYKWCCDDGFADDKWIRRSIKLAAPHFVKTE